MSSVRARRAWMLTLAALGAAWSPQASAGCERACESVKLTSLVVEPPLDCVALEGGEWGEGGGGDCGCGTGLAVRNDCSFPLTLSCGARGAGDCSPGKSGLLEAGETAYVTGAGLVQPREGETVFEFSLVEDGSGVEHMVTATFVAHYPPESSSCAVAASGRSGRGVGLAGLALAALAPLAAARRRRRP